MPEGRWIKAPTGNMVAEYTLSDNLGNLRATCACRLDTALWVLQENHYDPWGTTIGALGISGNNRFLYTGKETQQETGYIDFGARQYDPITGRWNGLDVLSERYYAWSPYHYGYNNPIKNIDPDGRSIWTKVAKAAFRISKTIAKEGINGLKKGANWADTVSDLVDNGKTVLDDKASAGDRVIAGLSLASEFLPVSIGDATDVYKGSKKLLGIVDGAGDASKAIKKGKRAFSNKDRTEGFDKSKDTDGKPRCEYCGTELDPKKGSPNSYEADHRDPYAKGGESNQDNLAPACRDCNRSKGKKDLDTEWTPPKKKN